jgi:hypothetical protein
MSNTLLNLVGLKRPEAIGGLDGTDPVTDSFHLLSTVWPLELGQHLFDRLASDLIASVYAGTH